MPKYIDADALKEKVKYSMLLKMGYLNECADAGREIPEEERKRILDSIDFHKAFIELIEKQPTVTINDHHDEIKVTNCNHIADDSKKVSNSWGHENDKSVIYRQDAIDAVIKRDANCGIDSAEVLKALPSAQPERRCVNCGRTVNNGGWYEDGRTRCPIEEHYALPKDGYCYLWEKKKVWEDDYVKRPEEGEK